MQHPTCTNIRIRSVHDAHKIFYAIQQGLLKMVTRRLDADERIQLRTGCVYAWEERGPQTELTGLGIERFTEGRRWSPSRVRDEFLFYYEKYSPSQDCANHIPPRNWDPLVKQTYSVWVDTEKGRRKWHLTAYFTQATVDQLGSIDDIQIVRDLVVPDSLFKSTRVTKTRSKTDESQSGVGKSSKISSTSTSVSRYAGFATSRQYNDPDSSTSGQVLMYQPYPNHYASSVQYHPNSLAAAVEFPPVHHYLNTHTSISGFTDDNSFQDPRRNSSLHPSANIGHADQIRHVALPDSWSGTDTQRSALGLRQASPHFDPLRHDSISADRPSSSISRVAMNTLENDRQSIGLFSTSAASVWSREVAEALGPSYRTPREAATLSDHSTPGAVSYPPIPTKHDHNGLDAFRIQSNYDLMSSPTNTESASSTSKSSSNSKPRALNTEEVALAPLTTLVRNHTYHRDAIDDKALRMLWPKSSS